MELSVMHQTFGQLKKNKASRGQATVEYILLIVIILALIMGPLYQFSKFVAAYTDALFGEGNYFACRLETGSLVDSSSDQCGAILSSAITSASQNNPIDGPNGHPPSSTPKSSCSTSSGDSGSSGSGSTSSSGQSGSPKSKSNPISEVADGSSHSADSPGSSSSASSGLGAASLNRRGRPDSESLSAAKTSSALRSAGTQKDPGFYDFQKSPDKAGTIINRDHLNRNFTLQDEEAKLTEKLSARTVATSQGRNLKPKEVSFDPVRAPAAKPDNSDDQGFSFSSFMKWLLIAGIIIALIVVVDCKLFQIMKSGDN